MGLVTPKHNLTESEWNRRTRCTAFCGSNCIGSGELGEVAVRARKVLDQNQNASILIFDDRTSELIEVDFRGTVEDVLRTLPEGPSESRPSPSVMEGSVSCGPGRPKLGVIGREVTLLPRHWEWLNHQPGGASVALRKLVEEARRSSADKDRIRASQEASDRFMSAMAGNLAGFEEALRALYAGHQEPFDHWTASWPVDIRDHARKLAAVALGRSSVAE